MSATQRSVILAEAEKLEKKGKLDAAIREYQKALRVSPGDVNLMNRLGDLHEKVNQKVEALEMFLKVAEHFGRDGFYLKAIACYKKANKLDPQRLDIYEKLAEFSYKHGLSVEGRLYLNTVADHFIRGRQPKEAVRVFRAMIDYEPTYLPARGKLVDLLVQLGDVDGVVREIEALGQSLVAQGRLDEALKFFLRALALKPANADFVAPGLDALVGAQRGGEAADLAERALALGHPGPALQRSAARAFVTAGEPARAREVLETLVAGSGFGLQAAELYADAIAQIGDVDLEPARALPVVDVLVGADDRGRAGALLKPLLRSHAGELEVLERAVKVFRRDDDPELVLETEKALAEAYYRCGRSKEAAELYNELIKRDPHDEVIRKRLQKLGGAAAPARPAVEAPARPPVTEEKPAAESAGASRADAEPEPGFVESETAAAGPEPGFGEPDVEIVDIDLDASPAGDLPASPAALGGEAPLTFELQGKGPAVDTSSEAIPSLLSSVPEAFEPLEEALPEAVDSPLSGAPPEAFEPVAEPPAEAEGGLPPLEVAPPVAPAPARPVPVPVTPPAETVSDASVDELFTEASVFAKYGLVDKAFSHLQRLLQLDPDHARARELFDNLSRAHAPVVSFAAPAAASEQAAPAAGPAAVESKASVAAVPLGTIGAAVGLSDTGAGVVAGDRAATTGALTGRDLDFELASEPAAAGAAELPPAEPGVAEPAPAPLGRGQALASEAAALVQPGGPDEGDMFEITGVLEGPNFDVLKEVDFFIQQGLLDEAAQQLAKLHETHGAHPDVLNRLAMLKARGWDEKVPARPAEGSAAQLFSEEEQFFDLAAELEKELAEEDIVQAARGTEPVGDVSIEDLFREFQRGVAEQVKDEDYDTHFNLGVAYREMGLLDEAIGEFQLALRSPEMFIDAASMIASCYTEKGLPEQAAQWYQRALEAPDLMPEAKMGLRYELGRAHEAAGNSQAALASYVEVLTVSPGFRDVVDRVSRLQTN